MRQQVNETNLSVVKEYIRKSSEYSFEKFLAEVGVLDSFEKSGNELKGCCLLHPERNPSASFNDAKGIWGCFSCGCGGDIIELMRLVKWPGTNYFQAAERILKADKKMQLALGISSVFEATDEVRKLKELKKPLVKLKDLQGALSYLDLAEMMRGCTLQQAKTAILFMQRDIPLNEFKSAFREEESILDLEEV